MGLCQTANKRENENIIIAKKTKNENINNPKIKEIENNNDNQKIREIDINLYKLCKSICEVHVKYSNNDLVGFGFLIKINEINFLMTNEHIIKKEIIDSNETIDIYYNNRKKNIKIKLNKNERYIEEFTNKGLDITIIRIKSDDNINEKYFLLPNREYMNDYNILINKKIYIPQYLTRGTIYVILLVILMG